MNQLRQLIRVLDALREVTGLYFVWKCSERSWLPLLPEHQRYHCCRYCRAVKESGAAALLGCNRHHAGAAFHLALEKRKPFPLLCPAGVLELVVPVVAGTCRAAIFAGPFLSPEGGRGAGREFAEAYAAMPKQPASAMQQFETLLTTLVESFEPESWEPNSCRCCRNWSSTGWIRGSAPRCAACTGISAVRWRSNRSAGSWR